MSTDGGWQFIDGARSSTVPGHKLTAVGRRVFTPPPPPPTVETHADKRCPSLPKVIRPHSAHAHRYTVAPSLPQDSIFVGFMTVGLAVFFLVRLRRRETTRPLALVAWSSGMCTAMQKARARAKNLCPARRSQFNSLFGGRQSFEDSASAGPCAHFVRHRLHCISIHTPPRLSTPSRPAPRTNVSMRPAVGQKLCPRLLSFW